MIPLSAVFLVVAAVLLAVGMFGSELSFVYGSIAASLLASAFLLLSVLRHRGDPQVAPAAGGGEADRADLPAGPSAVSFTKAGASSSDDTQAHGDDYQDDQHDDEAHEDEPVTDDDEDHHKDRGRPEPSATPVARRGPVRPASAERERPVNPVRGTPAPVQAKVTPAPRPARAMPAPRPATAAPSPQPATAAPAPEPAKVAARRVTPTRATRAGGPGEVTAPAEKTVPKTPAPKTAAKKAAVKKAAVKKTAVTKTVDEQPMAEEAVAEPTTEHPTAGD